AVVEIWQVDNNGSYIHSRGMNRQSQTRDTNFQGYGRFLTGSTREYYFRTIKPALYPGRTPHIQFAVKVNGRQKFITQCFFQGDPHNDRDMVLNGIEDSQARAAVIVPFAPIKESRIGELEAKFDVVLGFTPAA